MLRAFVFTLLTSAALTSTFTATFSATDQTTDADTGLIIDNGWELVKSTCTRCHAADIVRNNSGNREVWKSRIIWMQENQGLEQLDVNTETAILDYLAKNYPQKQATRRPPLAAQLMPINPYD